MSEKNGARVTAILLAAGKGTRMQSSRRKQFMELGGKTVLQWSFDTLKKSAIITDLVLVAPPEETEKVRNRYLTENGAAEEACVACKGLSEDESSAKDREGKPLAEKDGCDGAASDSFDHACVVAGGAERYNSVFNGIEAIRWPCDNVFIHDGARPLLTEEMLEKLLAAVEQYGAAVAACPSKDTVKIADDRGFVASTPDRARVWNIQTPQCFEYSLVKQAYETVIGEQTHGTAPQQNEKPKITDDAMVVEYATGHPIRLVDTGYRNIKITTPEDLLTAELFLRG